MAIDSSTIERTVKLANISITDEEKTQYTAQISEILSYVEKINSLDTSNIEPTDHIAELSNVMRTDTILPSIAIDEIRKFAPQFEKGHIVVPKIIEGE
jgi:aspartyl-tRNA(Asn)/glutamyl-tRNA(Gln) amidotransferase subunit C